MSTIEDSNHIELKRICPYTAGKLEVSLSFRNNSGVNVLREIDCPHFSKKDFHCGDNTCIKSDNQCGYLEYPYICSLIKF